MMLLSLIINTVIVIYNFALISLKTQMTFSYDIFKMILNIHLGIFAYAV